MIRALFILAIFVIAGLICYWFTVFEESLVASEEEKNDGKYN